MEKLEVVFKFMKQIVWGLVLQGILSIIVGVLIFIYPDLLRILVCTLLLVVGIIGLILAIKVNKYSKLKIEI